MTSDPASGEPGFAGVVLVGGSSRRMGEDKAALVIDGRSLAQRAADSLATAGADPVIGVGRAPGSLDLPTIADVFPGEGPVGGIIAALRWSPAPILMAVACDMPDIDPSGVSLVVDRLRATPSAAAAIAIDHTGRRQYGHGAWRDAALPRLETAFAAGARSIRAAIADLVVVDVEGVSPVSFADLDTPADLTAYRAENS